LRDAARDGAIADLVKLLRPLSAHVVALAPVAAAWAEPARASLASLSLCAWAASVHIAFACAPSRDERGSRADAARLAAALALPTLAIGFALDLRAGFSASALALVAAVALTSIVLLAMAGRNLCDGVVAGVHRGSVAALFVLPALLVGALRLVGLSTTEESVPWARAALCSPLAACLEFTLSRVEPRAFALALVGALSPLVVIALARRAERGVA
jgi:hypothetical protein